MSVPAICIRPNCGTVWFTDNAPRHALMIQCTARSCPSCGGPGRIPDGDYRPTSARLFNPADLQIVLDAIADLTAKAERGASTEELKREVETKYPFLRPLIPKSPSDLMAWLTAIGLVLSHCAKQPDDALPPQIRVQVEVQQILELVSDGHRTNQPNTQAEPQNKEVPKTPKK